MDIGTCVNEWVSARACDGTRVKQGSLFVACISSNLLTSSLACAC